MICDVFITGDAQILDRISEGYGYSIQSQFPRLPRPPISGTWQPAQDIDQTAGVNGILIEN